MINIKVINLKKSFGKNVLFKNLNLEFNSGEITCINGVSGCGKTTLLDIIGLIQKPDEGKILFNDKEIKGSRNIRKFLRKDIGFIFQDYGLIENNTVYENISIAYKGKKEDIKEKLILLNLDEKILDRKVYELSGGEQQRVTIAKILLKDPSIILADEPTASLDNENKKIILKHLRDLANNNKTVVIVSHEDYIVSFSDKVISL